mmetsp:Transcript_34258/g.108022  ORF Transcript_34258/g.108022 Transcript_34258/m.108022 type:complete len:394 (-) Transcript_34258:32-1213(-)|eukprot:CAMPEP_0118875786 /NCGR_PEP_ID=MMETSP1163-20130328/16733_1 /TAXON_ID=124430 /ORGANISM="Phaeomonas parva, Strain CCMP2877" /LENGTH=393 /DNA_ID=CAMNT_0006811323 /DNA_START=407 /DNA_END=1588 /DNA_ORIENTATION=+
MPRYVTIDVGPQSFTIDERYDCLKVIGTGAYGCVVKAKDRISGRQVAIKKVRKVFRDLVDAKRILREIKLLKHLKYHENIVRLYDIMVNPAGDEDFTDIYIVTNLMETDLHRVLSSHQSLTDQHYQYFLYQLLRGIKYIHSAGILHRDLKPSNILVNANCDLVICDFGLSRGVDDAGDNKLTEYVCTRWYRAPELLCECNQYGPGVDVWSVGCIFGEMLRRRPLFRGTSPPNQLEVIIEKMGLPGEEELDFVQSDTVREAVYKFATYVDPPPFDSHFPEDANGDALELLKLLLRFDPNHRISVEDALGHRYLHTFHSQMDEPGHNTKTSQTHSFDFEQEGFGPDNELPKPRLQQLMYREMLELRNDAAVAESKSEGKEGEGKYSEDDYDAKAK